MTDQSAYQIGDAVLADFNGAQIPGVIEDIQDDRAFVRLAEPWIDETGQKSDTQWVDFGLLSPSLRDAATPQALPQP